jgi:hypothetical protein
MDAQRQKILQSHLRSLIRTPPQYQLEVVRQGLRVNHGLYKQEGDVEGAELYRPLVEAANSARSVEELIHLVQQL